MGKFALCVRVVGAVACGALTGGTAVAETPPARQDSTAVAPADAVAPTTTTISTVTTAVKPASPKVFAPILAPRIAVAPPVTVTDVQQASVQTDQFQNLYQNARRIFGGEHLIISPSFYVSHDLGGRLDPTNKIAAGISGVLLLPLWGVGEGRSGDWWPVVTTQDATTVYQAYLNQLAQYKNLSNQVTGDVGSVKAIYDTKWTLQTLLAAKEIFCKDDVDWPTSAKDAIQKLCDGSASSLTCAEQTSVVNAVIPNAGPAQCPAGTASASSSLGSGGTSNAGSAIPGTANGTIAPIPDVAPASGSGNSTGTGSGTGESGGLLPISAPSSHNFLIGPAVAIPVTKNPIDIFQYGGAIQFGNDAFHMIVDGGMVGRYQGTNYKQIFAAGWFAGIALSGEIGDELFHYISGASGLLSELAQLKSTNSSTGAQQ